MTVRADGTTAPSELHAPGRPTVDCVATHHLDVFGSGVARFNEILAAGIGVDLVWLFDPRLLDFDRPLLSFKVSEMSDAERHAVHGMLDRSARSPSLFLHDYCGSELEERLVRVADRIYCGNLEVHAQVSRLNDRVETLWSPGLILDQRRFRPADLTVFSFGMAHKINAEMFLRLRALLQRSGRSYTLFVSAANHETASLRDADVIFAELNEMFPTELYFMGNLSDVAVYNYITSTTFFTAFFLGGARANNGSLACAMEHGAVVITNLDEYSPPELVHMENVIDITQADALPSDPLVLKRIGVAAMETARERSWSALLERFRQPPVASTGDGARALRRPA